VILSCSSDPKSLWFRFVLDLANRYKGALLWLKEPQSNKSKNSAEIGAEQPMGKSKTTPDMWINMWIAQYRRPS